MAPKTKPSPEQVRQWLDYDAESGVFRHKGPTSGRRRQGAIAGCHDNYGYLQIGILGRQWKAHALAWAYVHGEWPAEIDHINGDPGDNRIANLRTCSRAQNQWNTRRPITSTTGEKCITAIILGGGSITYRVRVKAAGARPHIGCFPDLELAALVRDEVLRRRHGEFARSA